MTDDDVPIFKVGDHFRDRESDDDAPMLVVGLPLQRAATYYIDDDRTVADANPESDETDPVVEVVFPQRTDVYLKDKLVSPYAYPCSRLELVEPIHDVKEDESDE